MSVRRRRDACRSSAASGEAPRMSRWRNVFELCHAEHRCGIPVEEGRRGNGEGRCPVDLGDEEGRRGPAAADLVAAGTCSGGSCGGGTCSGGSCGDEGHTPSIWGAGGATRVRTGEGARGRRRRLVPWFAWTKNRTTTFRKKKTGEVEKIGYVGFWRTVISWTGRTIVEGRPTCFFLVVETIHLITLISNIITLQLESIQLTNTKIEFGEEITHLVEQWIAWLPLPVLYRSHYCSPAHPAPARPYCIPAPRRPATRSSPAPRRCSPLACSPARRWWPGLPPGRTKERGGGQVWGGHGETD